MKLVAVYPILYGARQYEVGDELPDSEMKQTWLDAGTATLVEDEDIEAGSADREARTAPAAIEETTNVLNTLRLSTQVGTIIPNVTGYSFSTNQKETVRARIMRSVPDTILYKCVRVFF